MSNVVALRTTEVVLSHAEAREVESIARRAAVQIERFFGLTARVQYAQGRRFATAKVEYGHNCVAVTVGSYAVGGIRPLDVDVREWASQKESAPREVGVDVTAHVEWLIDQSLATEGNFGAEYASPAVSTVEEACEWVRAHCLRAPVPRVSHEERLVWERRVAVVDEKPVKLVEAVRRFGPKYGRDISVDRLVKDHAMSPADARMIVSAVKKVLPRRKS